MRGVGRLIVRRFTLMVVVVWLGTATAACASGAEPREISQPPPTHAPDLASTVPPSTDLALSDAYYEAGDCVVWNQDAHREVDTVVVPCSEPHLVEMAGDVSAEELEGPSKEFPSAEAWTAFFNTACPPIIEARLGRKLDPNGRYRPGGIKPLVEGWFTGDRQVWCGVAVFEAGSDRFVPFAGKFADLIQADLLEVGKCIMHPDGDEPRSTVPCSEPHNYEVVGNIDLTGKYERVPTKAQWDEITDLYCDRLVAVYTGRAPAYENRLRSSIYYIEPESWDAGTRATTCLGRTVDDAENTLVLTGSLKAGG